MADLASGKSALQAKPETPVREAKVESGSLIADPATANHFDPSQSPLQTLSSPFVSSAATSQQNPNRPIPSIELTDVEKRFASMVQEFPTTIGTPGVLVRCVSNGCKVSANGQLLIMSRRQLSLETPGLPVFNYRTAETLDVEAAIASVDSGRTKGSDWALFIRPGHRDAAFAAAETTGKSGEDAGVIARIEDTSNQVVQPLNQLLRRHPATRQLLMLLVTISGWTASYFKSNNETTPPTAPVPVQVDNSNTQPALAESSDLGDQIRLLRESQALFEKADSPQAKAALGRAVNESIRNILDEPEKDGVG